MTSRTEESILYKYGGKYTEALNYYGLGIFKVTITFYGGQKKSQIAFNKLKLYKKKQEVIKLVKRWFTNN